MSLKNPSEVATIAFWQTAKEMTENKTIVKTNKIDLVAKFTY